MKPYKKEYENWLFNAKDFEQELLSIKEDEKEQEYRFSTLLKFGTAGLRGVMMAGNNAMNIYTVRQATAGLAKYLLNLKGEERGVLIGMDSRIHSELFAKAAAEVLSFYGIKVYLYDELRPTPMVSFGLRYLNCIAGINITASHNPKEYNGYKVYFEDGAQISPNQAEIISGYIQETDLFSVKGLPFEEGVEKGIIRIVGPEIDKIYLEKVKKQQVDAGIVPKMADDLSVVYTPFHGAGYRLVPEILKQTGLKKLYIVQEQAKPDGSFPTVISPNPENPEGFRLGVELAKKVGSDLVIATDPDCDRVGVMARNKDGQFVTVSGNAMGALLLDYILSAHSENGTMPPHPYAVKTIVTTDLARAVCHRFSVKLYDVLTGFKYIGEVIKKSLEAGEGTFVLGYEESYGYLKGTYARDKDGVVASMLIVEMAAYYKKKNMTLMDALEKMDEQYGFYREKTLNIQMKGLDGTEKMKKMMQRIRKEIPSEIGGLKVLSFSDYLSGETVSSDGTVSKTGLPASDVLSFTLEDKNKVLVRPSGTEPKVKIYLLCFGGSEEEALSRMESFKEEVEKWV